MQARRPARDLVRSAIVAQPGITRSEVCRLTGLAWGTVWLHVDTLVEEGEVAEVPSRRKVFLVSRDLGSANAERLRLLRLELPTKILACLQARPGCGVQAVTEALGLSRKVVSRQLEALVAAGLVSRTDDFRARFEVAAPWVSLHRAPPPAPGPEPAPAPALPATLPAAAAAET